jgi:hypothetical protein
VYLARRPTQQWEDALRGFVLEYVVYTVEECVEEARKYTKKIDFRKNSIKYYNAARSLCCLDKCHEHMTNTYKTYTEEEILETAKLCNTRIEFRKNYNGYYQAARRLNLEEQCYAHMGELKHIWTEAEIRIEALRYTKRSDFMHKSGAPYKAAIRLGILDEVCSHMSVLVERWSREEIEVLTKHYSSLKDFVLENKQAYATCLRRGWGDLLCNLTKDRFWSNDELINLSREFTYSWEFLEAAPNAYKVAKSRGLLGELVICNKPVLRKDGSLIEPESWDVNKVTEAAKLCKTIGEFYSMFPGARKFCDAKGLLWDATIFSHFVRQNGKSIFEAYRTKEECHKEALKYTSRRRFYCGSELYYSYAKVHGWLDEICTHMTRGHAGFNPEKAGFFYVIDTDLFIGFGITNYLGDRLKQHKTNFDSAKVTVSKCTALEFASGGYASGIEKMVKKSFRKRILDTGICGFRREAVSLECRQELHDIVEKLLTPHVQYNIINVDTSLSYT